MDYIHSFGPVSSIRGLNLLRRCNLERRIGRASWNYLALDARGFIADEYRLCLRFASLGGPCRTAFRFSLRTFLRQGIRDGTGKCRFHTVPYRAIFNVDGTASLAQYGTENGNLTLCLCLPGLGSFEIQTETKPETETPKMVRDSRPPRPRPGLGPTPDACSAYNTTI